MRLVQHLMDGRITVESEAAATLGALKTGLVCPTSATTSTETSIPELNAEKFMARALAYEPFAL
ncbi:hypothetical protein ADK51_35620 [Streptomyces sp. WM6368]|nr:hypothetical protein ADK51_35620 [Streptomyces sp. WM6368]